MSLALGVAGPACAQVLEIGAAGEVFVHRGPAVFTDPGKAPAPIAPPPVRPAASLAGVIEAAAAAQGLSAQVVEAVAWQESRLNPRAVSPKGAMGVMQLMPATATELGVSDPFDAEANIMGGAAYLARMLQTFDGDLTLALAAYNAGPAAVKQYGGLPPFRETKAYVSAVMDRLANAVAAGGAP